MSLSKIFSNKKYREEENEKKCIVQGYPMTNTPIAHDNLKHAVKFQTFQSNKSKTRRLGFTYAHDGLDLVKEKGLEMMRARMLNWFANYPELAEQFMTKLPTNLVAISYSGTNFELGESCQDFKLIKKFKQPESAFFSYRKLSESVQCTYYNEDGVEYLAGVCYYPARHGRATLLESNRALMILAHFPPYPTQDRRETVNFKKYKSYPRFCKTAGKMVVISMSAEDGIPRHYGFDHYTKRYTRILCKECLEDHFTYKWEEPKKEKDVIEKPVSEQPSTSEPSEPISDDFERVELDEKVKIDSELDAELVD